MVVVVVVGVWQQRHSQCIHCHMYTQPHTWRTAHLDLGIRILRPWITILTHSWHNVWSVTYHLKLKSSDYMCEGACVCFRCQSLCLCAFHLHHSILPCTFLCEFMIWNIYIKPLKAVVGIFLLCLSLVTHILFTHCEKWPAKINIYRL